jgi:hypothetical protein
MAEFTQYFTLDRFSDRITTMPDVTPIYNWPIPEDTDLVKDGAEAIRDLAGAIETTVDSGADSGLVHIETQTFSAVSAVNFNGVFSADYNNYYCRVDATGSTSLTLLARLRSGTTDLTSSVYFYDRVRAAGGVLSTTKTNSATSYLINTFATYESGKHFYINLPFSTTYTTFENISNVGLGVAAETNGYYGMVNDTVSYDGISLLTSTGNITGSASIFAYRKS